MSCILSCSCSCSSSTQVLVSSAAPAGLKNSTFFLATKLARQIEDADLSLQSTPVVKTAVAIRDIKKLIKDGRAQLSKISKTKTTTPVFERVGALSTKKLQELQTKMEAIRDKLIDHGYIVKASPEVVNKLFEATREFERSLDLLEGYWDAVKDGVGEIKVRQITQEIIKFRNVINEVVDERLLGSDRDRRKQGVSRALIEQLAESRANKLQENVDDFLPELNKLIGEVSKRSIIKPVPRPRVSHSIFIAPVTTSQPSLLAISSLPQRREAFVPFPQLSEGDAEAGTEESPKLISAHVLDNKLSRYVIRDRQIRNKMDGDFIKDDSKEDMNSRMSQMSQIRPASPSDYSFSQVAASSRLKSFALSDAIPNAVPEGDSF